MISSFCQTIFSALLKECSTTPQAEVILLTRSTRIKLPMLLWFSKASYTTADAAAMSQTAISFLYSFDTAICSPVLTSILYLISITEAGTSLVPIFIRKFFPCLSSVSSIQRSLAVNMELTFSSVPFTRTHPLETSTSLVREIVTACPFRADSASWSVTRIDSASACSRLGRTVIVSPFRMLPASTCPWKPRKV